MGKIKNFLEKIDLFGLQTRGSLPQDGNITIANSLFGTIASNKLPFSTSMDFIPDGNDGETVDVNGDNLDRPAKWIGLGGKNMQYWAYLFCSPLAAVIDRLAEADTNGIIRFKYEDGTVVKNINKIPMLSRIKSLFDNPNPLQTWHEFNSQQIVLCKDFGYSLVWFISPFDDKSYSEYMFNLNPFYCEPRKNENYNPFSINKEDHNPIKEWDISIFGKKFTVPAKEILIVKDGYLDNNATNLGLPVSKVAGLDFFVSNICAAMEADNVLLKKKGPLGVFSGAAKPDMAGMIPMSTENQKDLQQQLQKYGLNLNLLQYVISKHPVKWEPMSFNLRDLMTKETVRQGIDGICDRLGYPAELMSGKNATYENRNSAEKYLYQNNIIPFSLRRMAQYCNFLGLNKTDYRIFMEYDHLPVLQEDILHAGEASKAESEGLDIEWKAGMITWNQWQVQKGRDAVAGMDIYYPDWLKANPGMNQNQAPATKIKDNKKT